MQIKPARKGCKFILFHRFLSHIDKVIERVIANPLVNEWKLLYLILFTCPMNNNLVAEISMKIIFWIMFFR